MMVSGDDDGHDNFDDQHDKYDDYDDDHLSW